MDKLYNFTIYKTHNNPAVVIIKYNEMKKKF